MEWYHSVKTAFAFWLGNILTHFSCQQSNQYLSISPCWWHMKICYLRAQCTSCHFECSLGCQMVPELIPIDQAYQWLESGLMHSCLIIESTCCTSHLFLAHEYFMQTVLSHLFISDWFKKTSIHDTTVFHQINCRWWHYLWWLTFNVIYYHLLREVILSGQQHFIVEVNWVGWSFPAKRLTDDLLHSIWCCVVPFSSCFSKSCGSALFLDHNLNVPM